MRTLTATIIFGGAALLAGCEKTGEGEYEVQKPVVGVETDTVNTPSVDVGTTKDTISVPTVETEEREVELPTVDVDPPK
ncbi:MAG TPA: hypothetical protein VK012_07400 [Gemmatimonadales bacterium]|nr:hypothetical protein [Gemmatimonadales bacterium]